MSAPGRKDTVIAYPGEITRAKATVDRTGLLVWAVPHRRTRGPRDDASEPDRVLKTTRLLGLFGYASETGAEDLPRKPRASPRARAPFAVADLGSAR
jgi:hypothetical protein